MWTLVYDLFHDANDAMNVTGALSFCWGAAAFVIPSFVSFILENDSLSSSTTVATETFAQKGSTTFTDTEAHRSVDFKPVIAMLCALLLFAFVCQFVVYSVIKKIKLTETEEKCDAHDLESNFDRDDH